MIQVNIYTFLTIFLKFYGIYCIVFLGWRLFIFMDI